MVVQAHKVQPNVGKWWSYHHSLSWWCCHLLFTWLRIPMLASSSWKAESLIYSWGQNACRQKLVIWCPWRPACWQSVVFWKFLPWDSLLNMVDLSSFVQILQYLKFSSLMYTCQVYFFNHDLKSFCPLELKEIYCCLCQM